MSARIEQAADLIERVLAATGSLEAAVTVGHHERDLTRFASSVIHQNVAEAGWSVSLTLARDGRVATKSVRAALSDRHLLERLVEDAMSMVEAAPVDPHWPGVLGPNESALEGGGSDADRSGPAEPGPAEPGPAEPGPIDPGPVDPEERAEMAARAVGALRAGVKAAGYCQTSAAVVGLGTSAGCRRFGADADVDLEVVAAADAGLVGSAYAHGRSMGELDGAEVGRRAAAWTRTDLPVIDVEPGEHRVLLSPAAVGDLVAFLGWYGFNAKSHLEGESGLRLGEVQFDEKLDLTDDPTHRLATGLPFDSEGVRRRRHPLVESGRVVGLAHDRRTAARFSERYGQKIHSTGGAVAGGERYGAFPLNPVISVTGDSRPVEDLLGDLGDGLWVNEFWYTRVLDPRTLVVTGLTRNGLYVVRNGQVVGTAPNLRFTQSYLAALGPGQVVMAGNDLSPTATGVIAPSLAISSWRFTGGARG